MRESIEVMKMQITSIRNRKMVTLKISDEDNYEVTDDNGVDVRLSLPQQVELLSWFWRNRPELIRNIVCENCSEHIGMIEQANYNTNKAENG